MSKSIKIADLIDKADAFLANSPDSARMERLAVAMFLQQVLHDTGNYAGFGYLVPYGQPGSDSSRVFHYYSHKLGVAWNHRSKGEVA